jgi:hypothetical protein
LGLAGGIGQARDKAIDGLRELQKKPDLKTKLPTQKTNCNYFSSAASQSIHWSTFRSPTWPNSKKLAVRRRWHEGCPQAGAMIATRRG